MSARDLPCYALGDGTLVSRATILRGLAFADLVPDEEQRRLAARLATFVSPTLTDERLGWDELHRHHTGLAMPGCPLCEGRG